MLLRFSSSSSSWSAKLSAPQPAGARARAYAEQGLRASPTPDFRPREPLQHSELRRQQHDATQGRTWQLPCHVLLPGKSVVGVVCEGESVTVCLRSATSHALGKRVSVGGQRCLRFRVADGRLGHRRLMLICNRANWSRPRPAATEQTNRWNNENTQEHARAHRPWRHFAR